MNNLFNKKLSDLVITIPIFLAGLIIIIWLFYSDTQTNQRTILESTKVLYLSFPLVFAAMYLWLKAVVEDFTRIKQQISVPIPGMVYLIFAFEWVTIWMANDLLYNSMSIRLGNPSQLKSFLLFNNPIILWIIIDILASMIINLIEKYRKIDFSSPKYSTDKNYVGKLLKQIFLSLISFFLASLIALFS